MSFFLNLIGLRSSPRPSVDKPKSGVAPDAEPDGALVPPGASERPTPSAEVPVARDICGAVDGFQPPGTFSGWAVNYSNPGNPLDIQILLDGKQIAAGVTSLQRPDISTEVVNTAGFWIDADRSVDPEQIVRGNIEILADGQLLAVWETLITKLKQNSEPSVGV